MKIKDLLNIEKAIETKKIELEEKKQELERLRQEAEELKLITDINNRKYHNDELINIKNMYLLNKKDSDIVCFVNKIKLAEYKYKFVDIYTNEDVRFFTSADLIDMEGDWNILYFCKHIKEAFPETRIYLDGMVPKLLIQKLYYQVNGIDEKKLKLGAIKD